MERCAICSKSCKTLQILNTHVICNHSEISREEYYNKFIKKEHEDNSCPVCGNPRTLLKGKLKLRQTCSNSKCRYTFSFIKIKATCLKKYGCENSLGSKEVRKKRDATMIEKYGDTVPLKVEKFRNKISNTYKQKYSIESKEQRNERVKVLNSPKACLKREKTCFERYGVTVYSKSQDFKDNVYKWKDAMVEKVIKQKIKNKTFNTSGIAENTYKILYTVFPDIKREYKCSRYPFRCDFYIPSLDLFIELNAHWTHGKHPFNINNEEDILILNEWTTKSNDSKFYANAIRTWTINDVNKRNKANENKIKYLEIFTQNSNDILVDIEKYTKLGR